MNFKLDVLTEDSAKEICSWKYTNEYSIYNYPSWSKMCNENWGITNEEKRKSEFNSIIDELNNLCGHIRLVNRNDYIIIGIGLKPSLCGKGFGAIIMDLVKDKCKYKYPNKPIILQVRSFNKRAIKCYTKTGFNIIDTYKTKTPLGNGEFVKMKYTFYNDCH
ncbi:GNAT family N-acetyltransferase [Clostridium senegalense]